MKIRLKENSLRIRLLRSEVDKLVKEGYLEEQTAFVNHTLIYAVQSREVGEQLSADFIENKITMHVPISLISDWAINSIIGFSAKMPITETINLSLLLEKDFVCNDETTEDQSDNYINPDKTC